MTNNSHIKLRNPKEKLDAREDKLKRKQMLERVSWKRNQMLERVSWRDQMLQRVSWKGNHNALNERVL